VQEVKAAGFEHVVVMGMGGSTMAPIVFEKSFPAGQGLPISVLDTTDPGTVQQIEQSVPLEKTLASRAPRLSRWLSAIISTPSSKKSKVTKPAKTSWPSPTPAPSS
jgi:hypothetical protein